jgi:hypothetical protein
MNVLVAHIAQQFGIPATDARTLLACLLWSMRNHSPEEYSLLRASIPAVTHMVERAPRALAHVSGLPTGRQDGRVLYLFAALGFSLRRAASFVRPVVAFIADCTGVDVAQRIVARTPVLRALAGSPSGTLRPVSMPPRRLA